MFAADESEGASSPAAAIGGRRLLLYSPSDATFLSPVACLMRSQLEVFSATEADVKARASFGRLVQKIVVGRVGVRCIHCRDCPAAQQAKGAVSYPASIRMLNQATRNWQRYHWVACPFIPASAREEFQRLTSGKRPQSSKNSQEYWIRRSGEMGLVDTATNKSASTPDYTSADSNVTKDEQTVEPEGIYFEDDARKLGLRILMPPDQKASVTAKKTKKRAEGKEANKKGRNAAQGKDRISDKRKNAVDNASQNTSSGTTSTSTRSSEQIMDSIVAPSEDIFSVLHNSLSIDDFADDASLMSDLERLAEEDKGGSGSMDGDAQHNGSTSACASVNLLDTVGDSAPPFNLGSVSGSDLQLLSTLRAARGMVQSLRQKYDGASATGRQAASELRLLGEALYRTLAGEDGTLAVPSLVEGSGTDDSNDERLLKRERRRDEEQPKSNMPPLQDLGYPTSISVFVQSLIGATNEDAVERFTSLSDVDSDLRLMIDCPDKYLFDPPPEALTGRLRTAPGLYGIQTQQSKLMDAFQSVVVTGEERHGLALISGRSGSGKTSLVETLSPPLRERRGSLIQIKFDKKDNQSLPSIFRALDQYCQDLQGDLDLLNDVGTDVKAALGSFGQILLSQMPNLSALIGETSNPLPTSDNKERYNLLLNCLQTFVRAISAPSHPAVILFDDLQWTDAETLGLITKLVKDTGTKSCLFVGCYRDNEVLADHPLLEYLGEITFAGVPMWQIFLERIERMSINKLLSDTLHLVPRITAPLAREIYKKTGGNPHFAKQLLQSLHDERLIQYSPNARRWQWDLVAIRSKSVPDNAVALLLERMSQYGPEVQRVLQVAALMGRRFDALSLKLFQAGGEDISGDGSAILAHIDTLIDDGLICIDKAELRFAHDSIWEAALSLTPVLERESMHLLIGRQLLHAVSTRSSENLDIHLRLIIDQMNRGSGLIEAHDEKLRLAELNLQAGKETLAAYSFLEASLYLLKGCALLSENDWDSNYKLSLDIFTACAEAQFAHGNRDGAISSANVAILHGRNLNDKLRAHFTVYAALFTQGKTEEACHKALCVLEELGIYFPSLEAHIDAEDVRSELEKTESKAILFRFEEVAATPLPTAIDDAPTFAMRFLFYLSKILYVKKPDLMTLVICRMVQICTERALTSESSFAFANYSALLCKLGLRDRSAMCARIATGLLDRFQGKYSQQVSLSLCISIQPYRQPWHACLDSFDRTIHDATAVGDIESALFCHSFVPSFHIFAPVSTLQDAREKVEKSRQNLISCGHPLFFMPTTCLQTLLNLVAPVSTADPTILRGDATNQEEILSILPESNMYYGRLIRKVEFARMYLGYLFQRHTVVLDMASKVTMHLAGSKFYYTLDLLLEKFYLGLAAYAIVRQGSVNGSTDAEKWRLIGEDVANEMKGMSENDSEWNFEQKYFLLEAEKAFTDGNVEVASIAYDKAIEAAREHRFINEQALASECAALFYLNYDNIGQARIYFEKSRDLYEAWGAHRKVEHIGSLLEQIE